MTKHSKEDQDNTSIFAEITTEENTTIGSNDNSGDFSESILDNKGTFENGPIDQNKNSEPDDKDVFKEAIFRELDEVRTENTTLLKKGSTPNTQYLKDFTTTFCIFLPVPKSGRNLLMTSGS